MVKIIAFKVVLKLLLPWLFITSSTVMVINNHTIFVTICHVVSCIMVSSRNVRISITFSLSFITRHNITHHIASCDKNYIIICGHCIAHFNI